MPDGFACPTRRMLDHGQPPPRPGSRSVSLPRYPPRIHTPVPCHRTVRRPPPDTGKGTLPRLGLDGLTPVGEYRLLHPFDYACRPRLRTRLTRGRRTWPRNPWSSSGRDSDPSLATHVCILTSTRSTAGSRRRFAPCGTLSYPVQQLHCRVFGGVLEPRYIIGAEPLDQ